MTNSNTETAECNKCATNSHNSEQSICKTNAIINTILFFHIINNNNNIIAQANTTKYGTNTNNISREPKPAKDL